MSNRQSLPPLSEKQLAIMNVIWDHEETTVGEVWAELSESRSIARNTVQTMIVRLEEKGWLKHRTEGNTYYYSATQPSHKTRKRMAQRLLDTVFEGSTEGLLMAILDDQTLSKSEAARIRKLIDQASRRSS
ncbi:MAG: BlaI/MecI/CopY family transcriptional regulator [Planctomycetaceae bacterium]|nr:BlaI/MecI/CopY family transcriptional regulator [Planctomycetaceae bacterium]